MASPARRDGPTPLRLADTPDRSSATAAAPTRMAIRLGLGEVDRRRSADRQRPGRRSPRGLSPTRSTGPSDRTLPRTTVVGRPETKTELPHRSGHPLLAKLASRAGARRGAEHERPRVRANEDRRCRRRDARPVSEAGARCGARNAPASPQMRSCRADCCLPPDAVMCARAKGSWQDRRSYCSDARLFNSRASAGGRVRPPPQCSSRPSATTLIRPVPSRRSFLRRRTVWARR